MSSAYHNTYTLYYIIKYYFMWYIKLYNCSILKYFLHMLSLYQNLSYFLNITRISPDRSWQIIPACKLTSVIFKWCQSISLKAAPVWGWTSEDLAWTSMSKLKTNQLSDLQLSAASSNFFYRPGNTYTVCTTNAQYLIALEHLYNDLCICIDNIRHKLGHAIRAKTWELELHLCTYFTHLEPSYIIHTA